MCADTVSLRSRLAEQRHFGTLPSPSAPYRLEKAVREIRRELGDVTPKEPAAFDLVETYKALQGTTSDLSGLKRLPMRHLRRAPWVMFQPPVEEGETLAENKRFLVAYLSELRQRASASAILTLVTVYLKYYPTNSSFSKMLPVALVDLLKNVKTSRGIAFRERCKKYHLLKNDGPIHVAMRMLKSGDPDSVMEQAGLVGILEQQGFIEASSFNLLNLIRDQLERNQQTDSEFEMLLGFFESKEQSKRDLRFPSLRIMLVESLMLPFVNREPDPAIKSLISQFILNHYNDPRLNQNNWHGVSDQAIAVMRRWLVRSTLLDFFRVVSEGSMKHRDADRMWKYRRAFWTAYLEYGHILDAWVVLGDEIAHDARAFLQDQADAYGRLRRGSGVLPRHAVLIMRIGDLVITEWNYSGKYRVWSSDSVSVPQFYKRRYDRGHLVSNPDFDGAHMGAENGNWQHKLSNYIYKWTNISVGARQYMPK